MKCQTTNKVQGSTNNLQTNTSQTEGIKFENKRKKVCVRESERSFLWLKYISKYIKFI